MHLPNGDGTGGVVYLRHYYGVAHWRPDRDERWVLSVYISKSGVMAPTGEFLVGYMRKEPESWPAILDALAPPLKFSGKRIEVWVIASAIALLLTYIAAWTWGFRRRGFLSQRQPL